MINGELVHQEENPAIIYLTTQANRIKGLISLIRGCSNLGQELIRPCSDLPQVLISFCSDLLQVLITVCCFGSRAWTAWEQGLPQV